MMDHNFCSPLTPKLKGVDLFYYFIYSLARK